MLVDKIKLQCYIYIYKCTIEYFCARCDIKCVFKLHWKILFYFIYFILLVFRQGKTASAKKAVLQLCPVTTYNTVQHTLHITTEQNYKILK